VLDDAKAESDDTHEVDPAGPWQPFFDKLWQLRDTSDFDLLYLNNLIEAPLRD
jgi:hypothetical protein